MKRIQKLLAIGIVVALLCVAAPMAATAAPAPKLTCFASTGDGVIVKQPVANKATLNVDQVAGSVTFMMPEQSGVVGYWFIDDHSGAIMISTGSSVTITPLENGHTYDVKYYNTQTKPDPKTHPDWSATVRVTPTSTLTMTMTTDASGKTKSIADGGKVSVPIGTAVTLTASQAGYWQITYPSGLTVLLLNPSQTCSFTASESGDYRVSVSAAWPWEATITAT
ncbi:MAG: hypothetical protein ACXV2E_03995 [Halobacteriota archaeon]